jgi:phytoene dehydrogenase-like protein
MTDDSMMIIGAGTAGLAAGIYAQMNGYESQIFEMHTLPGGLCTAWKREGYTIDGCVHWLVGSSPESSMYRFWEEVGVMEDRKFLNLDEYARFEGEEGRTLIFYTDVNKLEAHLLELSPEDAEPIADFIQGIRLCLQLDPPSEQDSFLTRLKKMAWFVFNGRKIQRWMGIRADDFAERFKDPLLRNGIREMWFPEFSIFFMLFTFAYLHAGNAGYPMGGSLPIALDMAKRYKSLGGVIHYNRRVEKILVENDRAVGVRLADGREHRAGTVISAADGHTTLYEMLEGKYGDETTYEPYREWPTFPALLYIGVGVQRTFEDEPQCVSGISYPLEEPLTVGDTLRERLEVRIFNQDPTLAPEGKTILTLSLPNGYEYWKDLSENPQAYERAKEQVAQGVIKALEQRFPRISEQVEMVDVATPLTFQRYTGNWKGSFEGWLLTPENALTMIRPMRQDLPGLARFSMCGQWVEPGGGLPTSVMSGRRLVKSLCRADGKPFQTSVP